MKRVLSLVLALSMVMSMFTFSFAGTGLKDVAGTEYESAVEALVELGVVNGYDDGTFLPENVVSRAEMAKLLVVAAGLAPAAELAEGTTKFSDVAADHWATGYINVAAEYGYIMGDPDGSFRPDDTVSYAEAITMALRVLGYKTVVEAKGTWPTNYIAKAEELDLLEDITYGTYATGAKRGNVALLIWNMLRE
ncbi:MAG: S-layer homology domain-containing protein, partial [Clostridia bacterium]|nr:S-layer homology domain-containing protein [Clostridia bacterium]